MRRGSGVVAVLIVLVTLLQAQKTLTLQDCLLTARGRSPLLQAAANRTSVSALSYDELLTQRLPQVSMTASAIIAPSSLRFGYDPAITDGGQIAAQVVLHQSIYDAGVRSLQARQLRLEHAQTTVDHRRLERDLDFAVTQAFVTSFKAQRRVDILRESQRRLSDYSEVVRRLQQGGSVSRTDVLKTQLRVTEGEVALRTARGEDAAARLSLAEVIGIEIDTTMTVVGTLDTASAKMPDGVQADSLHSLELTALDLERQRSILSADIARRERVPNVSLVADAGYLSSGDNLRASPPDRYNAFGVSLGVQVELPILSWGATDLRVQQRELESENVRLAGEVVRRELIADYRRTSIALSDAEFRLRSLHAARETADEHYILTVSRYMGGEISSLEVLDAQQILTETDLSVLDAAADIEVLRAKLAQLTTR